MTRTSVSHPILVSELAAGNGVLGLTFCPGKQGDSLTGAPWERDLSLDVSALKVWGASTVVTLMERHEFELLRVPDLGEMIQAAGLNWVHLPIRDVSIPGRGFPAVWANLTKSLQRRLDRGEKIILHCRGGLGRTGLVAALVLLDMGQDAETAIREVRKVRPGAIETREQEDFVRRHGPYLCHASLLGGAIGDSLGADIEFSRLADIRKRFPNGVDRLSRTHAVAPGWFTDDTQMTLFTAEGIVRAHVRGALKGISTVSGVVHHALLRWFATQGAEPVPSIDRKAGLIVEKMMWHRAAPGMTCLSALEAARGFGDLARNDSKGCGTIMRVAPVAFGVDRKDIRKAAMETSALTHGHPVGQMAAAAWAEMLAGVVAGQPLEDAAEYVAHAYMEMGDAGKVVADAIHGANRAPADGQPETVERLGGGWVAEEALAIALYGARVGKGFEDGLRIAVTHSGDSDSTGAIAGNMLGVLYPDQVFAHPWSKEVGGRALVASLALDLPLARFWDEDEADHQFVSYPGW